MNKYKVIKEGLQIGETPVEIGASIELDETQAISLVEGGFVELEVESVDSIAGSQTTSGSALPPEVESETEVAAQTTVDELPKLYFNGKRIISDGVREVEGKEVKHVRLEDGTSFDLTDEEYKAVLEAANK